MRSGNREPHGKTVRLPAGYDAFVPAPLPPAIEWDPELVNALSAADRAIGRLAGESRRLPNPHLVHAQFEGIHPFRDGNGRVGRLVITLLLVERDVLKAPLLYLSAWFESTRQEYYARLLGTTAAGEWHEWLIYFLHGVANEAEDAARRIRTIDTLMLRWRTQLAKGKSRVPEAVLELFRENPFWTTTGIAQRLGIAFTTAGRAIERLQAAGIVAPAGDAQRNRVFCAGQMLEVLERR